METHQPTSSKKKPIYSLPLAVNVDGKTITGPHKVCEKVNEHFVKIGGKLSNNQEFFK